MKNVEIYYIDEEGILIRSHQIKEEFYFEGDPEDPASPLIEALKKYYRKEAPHTLMCKGFSTPRGDLFWTSEMASIFGEEDVVEIGERLYLADEAGERIFDEFAYADLSAGAIPLGWELIPR